VTEDKTALDQVLEAAIYAPIGFALEAKRLLPEFVERGRQQVNMAKMVGQFAVNHGQAVASKRVSKLQEQADSLLAEFGITTPMPAGSPSAAAEGTAEPAPAGASAPPGTAQPPAPGSPEVPPPDALPISNYDSLAASQVIPRLDGLDAAELDAVRAYEAAHRGRKTILGKIAQLSDG
jgi:hypothetical protein